MPEGTQIWIDALRSGKYKQGRAELGDEEFGLCCLGVACHVAYKHGVISEPHNPGHGSLHSCLDVMKWVGLQSSCGRYDYGSLTKDNDDHELTFDQIADIIEYNPPGLLV